MKKRIKESLQSFTLRLRKGKWTDLNSEDGSAMVIALLIMILLMGFVALAVTRTNSETLASANDATESRTFDAANASLEIMTRNFDKIFDVKLNPDPADIARVQSQTPPGFPEFTFNVGPGGQQVQVTRAAQPVIMKGGEFQGLTAMQDEWQLDTVATHTATGVQVALRRRFLNNRIPIFQFGIFYDDDMEFHPGPVFNFGGRVHSNGNIFLMASSGLHFDSKVTAKNNIFTDVSKSGRPYTDWGENVWVKNGSGVEVQVKHDMGSVLSNPVNGAPVSNYATNPVPTSYKNANWKSGSNFSGLFDGNLLANQAELRLPIKINAQQNGRIVDLVELVKRGKNVNTTTGTADLWNDRSTTVSVGGAGDPGAATNAAGIVPVSNTTRDDGVTASERYYNKTGIRVSLADSKAKLPGCAQTVTGAPVTTPCGVQLDGNPDGVNLYAPGTARGYNPNLTPMTGGAYTTTEINGERFFTQGKEVWIKIETVAYDATTQNYVTVDITKDILALGVTERAPDLCNAGAPPCSKFRIVNGNYWSTNADSRSVIKLQRFMAPGPWTSATNSSIILTGGTPATSYISSNANGWTAGQTYNYVEPATVPNANTCTAGGSPTAVNNGTFPNNLATNRAHWKEAEVGNVTTTRECVEAFPINMFDTREGLFNDTSTVFNPTAAGNYGTNIPWAGVMSMVDIDVANLRNFLNGNFDGGPNPGLPLTGTPFSNNAGRALRSTDIPSANGWVLYVSDRRGDRDFDGEYDMEDIFGPNDGTLQLGEDVNGNGTLQVDYSYNNPGAVGAQEAVKYIVSGDLFTPPFNVATGWGTYVSPGIAAVFEHPFYRRGVRLINGSDLPGAYDTTTPSNTKGFTVASENAVYVFGNYNATGVASHGTPTPYTSYNPQGARDVPASVAADAVMILSNNWSDARSFRSPFTLGDRPATETTARFAMLSGDAITTLGATPNQGGGDVRMNGGVHNFKRFLENWSGVYLNYTGSLINLYYSHNNNGPFKCCNDVYSPPTRNWVFDATFLDINRIPPGTPFFQSIQITGFQRINN